MGRKNKIVMREETWRLSRQRNRTNFMNQESLKKKGKIKDGFYRYIFIHTTFQ